MKTLDEVIKAFEYTYENDPIAWTYGADALHYLKVLQKMQRAQPVTKGEWDELYNNPLTWEELLQMEGKPVWVEYADDEQQTGWALIAKNPERPMFGKPKLFTLVREDGKIFLTISGYGKRWKAYRKERK